MWGGNIIVVTMPPHGENTQDSTETYPGGSCWKKGAKDICGVFSAGTEVGGILRRLMPSKGEQTIEIQITLYVLALEFEGGNYKRGTITTTVMQSL